jgi:glucose/arabinose dehydrogenase
MNFARLVLPCLSLAISLLTTPIIAHAEGRVGPGVPEFWVRPGYKVTLAAEDFGRDTRFLEVDDRGTLYLSQPTAKKVIALQDKDGDGVYETKSDFLTDQDGVHGMHFKDGWLWFGKSGAVAKARVGEDGKASDVQIVVEGLPSGGGHWWRSICVVDDGFFTSIGDSGNMTADEYEGSDRQKIWKYSLDGKTRVLWSSGIRNTEKLRIRPGTNELWGADHGSDNFGAPYGEANANKQDPALGKQAITDMMPPEEFNHYIEGGFYGHPFVVGERVPRLEFKDHPDIAVLAARTIVPVYKGGAHWANNGFTFTTRDTIGTPGDAYIAYHGSWNSQTRVGYQVHRVLFDPETGKPYGGYAIVEMLTRDGKNTVLGRPVDVVEAADGSLLVSDDRTAKIWRISKE